MNYNCKKDFENLTFRIELIESFNHVFIQGNLIEIESGKVAFTGIVLRGPDVYKDKLYQIVDFDLDHINTITDSKDPKYHVHIYIRKLTETRSIDYEFQIYHFDKVIRKDLAKMMNSFFLSLSEEVKHSYTEYLKFIGDP